MAYRIGFGMLLFFTNSFINNSLLKAYEAAPVKLTPSQKFNTGILLGGLVSYSPADQTGYFNNASDRFIQTALLYQQGHINNIIVAAGSGISPPGCPGSGAISCVRLSSVRTTLFASRDE